MMIKTSVAAESQRAARFVLFMSALFCAAQLGWGGDNPDIDLHGGTVIDTTFSDGVGLEPTNDEIPGWQIDDEGINYVDDDGTEAEPVDLFTGQFFSHKTDFRIRTRVPLAVTRRYRSGATYQGMFGRGWNIEFNERLLLQSDGSLLLRGGNTALTTYTNRGDDVFLPPPGKYTTIAPQPDGSYEWRSKHGLIKTYDVAGRLVERRDRNGNRLLFTYDAEGKLPINAISDYTHFTNAILVARDYRLTRMEIAHTNVLSGRYIEFAYNSDGRVTNAVDFTGRRWTYGYDTNGYGELLTVTTPLVGDFTNGLTTSYSYTDDHRLCTITDPRGITYLTNIYDSVGRVVTQHWGDGTYRFEYPTATIRRFYDANGFRVDRTFDSDGHVLLRDEWTGALRPSEPSYYRTAYEYDNAGRQTKVIYPRGNVEERKYDSLGNLIEVRRKASDRPDSSEDLVSRYAYETNFNFVSAIVDPLSNRTEFVYDYEQVTNATAAGNPSSIVLPVVDGGTGTLAYAWTELGDLASVTDPSGRTTYFKYNGTGIPVTRIDAPGSPIAATNRYEADAYGNVTNHIDPLGTVSAFSYDTLDRVTNGVSGELSVDLTYTAQGDVARMLFASESSAGLWREYALAYDTLRHQTNITDAAGRNWSWAYDSLGQTESLADPESVETFYAHDARGSLMHITDALTGETEIDVDGNFNVTDLRDALDRETRFVYDHYDRPCTNEFPDGSEENYRYDGNGRMTSLVLRAGMELPLGYDARGRLTRVAGPTDARGYVYDESGHLLSATNSMGTVSHVYDAMGRAVVETNANGWAVQSEYDRAGNRTRVAIPGQLEIARQFDSQGLLTNIWVNHGLSWQFTYDALGQPTRTDRGNGISTRYEYDPSGFLTNVVHFEVTTSNVVASFSYALSDSGMRTNMTTYGVPHVGHHEYIYDSLYRLESVRYPTSYPFHDMEFGYDAVGNRTVVTGTFAVIYAVNDINQYTNVGGEILTYDGNGNTASDGTNTYAYDEFGCLVGATTPTYSNIVYRYDAYGRRVEKNVDGTVERYVHDGYHVLADLNAADEPLRWYVHSDVIDGLLGQVTTNASCYFLRDGLGNVTHMMDASGSAVLELTYDVYGTCVTTGTTDTVYRFTGRRCDEETGLYYYRARYYSPQLGRFLQPDPIAWHSGDPNFYSYVRNNPVNMVDPLGMRGTVSKGRRKWDPIGNFISQAQSHFGRRDLNIHKPSWIAGQSGAYRENQINALQTLSKWTMEIGTRIFPGAAAISPGSTLTDMAKSAIISEGIGLVQNKGFDALDSALPQDGLQGYTDEELAALARERGEEVRFQRDVDKEVFNTVQNAISKPDTPDDIEGK
jgi:RHS repeat-associated protein